MNNQKFLDMWFSKNHYNKKMLTIQRNFDPCNGDVAIHLWERKFKIF